jgi:transposase
MRRLEKQLALIVPEWSMAPVVETYQAMRGASFLVAVTFAAEIGRWAAVRYAKTADVLPRSCPSGKLDRRYDPTEGPHSGRQPARAAGARRGGLDLSLPGKGQRETLGARLEALPKPVRDIAWKAQIRLCARYRRLSATGKKPPVVVAAIAREMAAFLWAIGREVAPA